MDLLSLALGFLFGSVFGAICLLIYIILPDFSSRGVNGPSASPIEQDYNIVGIPEDLRQLFVSGQLEHPRETCHSFSLLIQFLFQEFRDSKVLRKWILKKLQIDFNELMSRNAIGSRIIKDIRVHHLDIGDRAPVIRSVNVQSMKLSQDEKCFESLNLLLQIEYRGNFALSMDISAMLGQELSLSVSVSRLVGEVRFQFTRIPFTHWSICFIRDPTIDFKVDPVFRGRPLSHIVTLIMAQIRRTIRKRHVFPAFKLRFRPLLMHPLLQPSSDLHDFRHITASGHLKLMIHTCSRLNLSVVPGHHDRLYCFVSVGEKAFTLPDASTDFVTLALKFVRYPSDADVGLGLCTKYCTRIDGKYSRPVVVSYLSNEGLAKRANFQLGDRILAVNNTAISSERQALKLLTNTLGDVITVVDRMSSRKSAPVTPVLAFKPDLSPVLLNDRAGDEIPTRCEKTKSMVDLRKLSIGNTAEDNAPITELSDVKRTRSFSTFENNIIELTDIRTEAKGSTRPVPMKRRKHVLAKRAALHMASKLSNSKQIIGKRKAHEKSTSKIDDCKSVDPTPTAKIDNGKNLFEKRSNAVNLNKDITFQERFNIAVDPERTYLTICLYSSLSTISSECAQDDSLLCYVSLLIPEILDDCASTRSMYTRHSYMMKPASEARVPPDFAFLSGHAGFDARLCYGDITLGFQWCPGSEPPSDQGPQDGTPISAALNSAQLGDFPKATLKPDIDHAWTAFSFPRSTVCQACQHKIWLKWGLKCQNCSFVCHRKCCKLPQALQQCGEVSESAAAELTSDASTASNEEAVEAFESMELLPEQRLGYGRRLHATLTDKFAGLRRRNRPKAKPVAGNPLDSSCLQGTSDASSSAADGEAEAEHADFWQSMLYTKEGTYNEHMIHAAKDLGKDLFAHLEPPQRKAKMNLQVDLVQKDIDTLIEERLVLLRAVKSEQNSDSTVETKMRLKEYDEKLQSLAILMLHYCAGLQNCMDQEEAFIQ